MNAVEIEEAVSELANQPFDAAEFPFAFLAAFGNKETTIKRLRTASANSSDVAGGVLQKSNIHIATCAEGKVGETLVALRNSPKTASNKAKFILATDGVSFEAEDVASGETIACAFPKFPDHFGFFLPLAGITTVKQIRESSFDIRATGRLNKLYIELLKDNPDWATAARRPDMNHFMARLIFCFFAEDTDIFNGEGVFTSTVDQMSERDSSNTHEVISSLFRAMNTKTADRVNANLPRWANGFPYVNGGLFSGSTEVPRFSKIARSYLLHIGSLNWKLINPDIFGSMIQAVADDDERGALGMHYTSVPNILKVLNPLFLDDLREKLAEAGDNARKLLNLRTRMASIRVFDPACGSGNFLVIAYKQMREIEAKINWQRGEPDRRTDIPLTNFRGIEFRDFPAEVARLALIIAEYQCDVLYRGQKEALAEFLPLDAENWIVCGNALRLDWLSVCPPTGIGLKIQSDDLFHMPLDQPEIDFVNQGGETYICGNPPYVGSARQTEEQKDDVRAVFESYTTSWKSLDYVACWFVKAAWYSSHSSSSCAFVTTNSICQGEQVSILWPIVFATGQSIHFAHASFKWSNLASNNAGVTVAVVGLGRPSRDARLYEQDDFGDVRVRLGSNINPYLVFGPNIIVTPSFTSPDERGTMIRGNMPTDGGNLVLAPEDLRHISRELPEAAPFTRRYLGSDELIGGKTRGCLWIEDEQAEVAQNIPFVADRIRKVREARLQSTAKSTRTFSGGAHRFLQIQGSGQKWTIAVARVSSERRPYLPADLLDSNVIISDLLFGIYDNPLWNLALVVSKLHLVWVATVCGKLETRYRYSNALGWNTFPLPSLTEKNKADLTRCAEDILLAREEHFPATIADLYDPDTMPANLRAAHDRNDEVIERIYIGRRFRNDTERLEKLFELYTKMTADKAPKKSNRKGAA
ncbi:class I SAM-dependent DNA methyltransferase [Rhizobium sp. NZLR8]|uniref:class I SAM-dependent DNA methyltransferase n=1 Tax=Rhizobium sp. NZLR8 TaxID=2731104 RepID=UPI001C834148|nr:DNA methyltransferase [Rhizobium sp. NZLR8]MBX5160572.1 class I SAM-dependent DNA methyltransferase [Rhizobium sp. NZLR8]